MITHPLGGNGCLAFEGADFEECVERAEANDGCYQEDRTQHYQDNTKNTCDESTKIKISNQSSEDGTDDAVEIGNIVFHRKISSRLT